MRDSSDTSRFHSRFHSPRSDLVLSQDLRQGIGDYSILARLQDNRGDPDGAVPIMSASTENYGWLHACKFSIHLTCVNGKLGWI